jgi:methylated-DNA-protein-cysteine methyltransferase-like protein
VVGFNERVYEITRRVPRGRVTTYGAIARALGDPRKAREVGWALGRCPDDVPAQRVINAAGAVSGPSFGTAEIRRQMLEAEGVRFGRTGRCDLKRYFWDPEPPG